MTRVLVCGLGPGAVGDVTAATRDLLTGQRPVFLRTARHPTASLATGARTFDGIYDAGDDLASVYRTIAASLVRAADEHGEVVYAVPGSPLVLERSVAHLRAQRGVEVVLFPAVSFLDAIWARLGIDPVEESVRLVDGHTFALDAAGERGPLLVAHAHASWVLSDIKLAVDAGPEQRALVLKAVGTPDEEVFEVDWPDLDRVQVDHLTSLYLPEVAVPVARELQRSVELMSRLRAECPWDREQTHGTLRRHLVEETAEVLEALDRLATAQDDHLGEPVSADAGSDAPGLEDYALLEEELGDLWFQILFHAELAAEAGQFTIADVARTLHDKLVDRHPHVFGGGPQPASSEALVADWEARKRVEKARESAMDGLPPALPALSLAEKVLRKAARAGRSLDPTWVDTALSAELGPDASGEVLGAFLLAAVERARTFDLDPETSLRLAANAAADRFRATEAAGGNWILG